MEPIGFDYIGDLNLTFADDFNWENKATSLFLIVHGNISSDVRVVFQTLDHLSRFYLKVIYTPGCLEYSDTTDVIYRTEELAALISLLPKVVLLHKTTLLIDGVAVVGVNGWMDYDSLPDSKNPKSDARAEDEDYLYRTVEKLQRYRDITDILVVSASPPNSSYYITEPPEHVNYQTSLDTCTWADTEHKIHHWIYGGLETQWSANYFSKMTDFYGQNNPYTRLAPYHPMKLEIQPTKNLISKN